MLKAIDDGAVFNSLTIYKPTRGVHAQYVNDKPKLFISIGSVSSEIKNMLSSYKSVKVDLNGTLGYWFEVPMPLCPLIQQNEMMQQDMTRQPNTIKTSHLFIWCSNGVYYSIVFLPDKELSMEKQ